VSWSRRWAKAYGTRALQIAAGANTDTDLGIYFGGGLYQCEVEYLVRHEWAMTADDIIWRRTKVGLRLTEQEKSTLAQWLSDNYSGRSIHAT
jgi:glycerol-3-phosphate dehydrogenase